MRSYFREGGDKRFFIAASFLGRAVADIETIVVTDEGGAAAREPPDPQAPAALQREAARRQAVPLLRLVDPKPPPRPAKRDLFPRVEVVRNIRDDGARYFGPYHSATAARKTLRLMNRHFQLRTCTDTSSRRAAVRACSTRSSAARPVRVRCATAGTRSRSRTWRCFSTADAELGSRLVTRMAGRAESEDFEPRALRDSLAAVERTLAKQHIVQDDFVDQDVWGIFREADCVRVI